MGKKKAEPERNILWYLENGWPEHPEGEVSYHSGLRRVKPAFSNIYLPEIVLSWAVNKDGMIPMPDDAHHADGVGGKVRKALKDLDKIAENWPLIDSISQRLDHTDVYYKIVFQLLGQDYSERNIRLRVAVARAIAATWRYSHHYQKWKHTYVQAREIKEGCENFVAQYGNKIESMNERLKRMSLGGEMKGAGDFLHDDMLGFIKMLDQYTSAPKHPFEVLRPMLYLHARLGEIYSCFSGELPDTHASVKFKKFTKGEQLPESDYLKFLEPALIALGFPYRNPHNYLAGVAKHVSGNRGCRNKVLINKNGGLLKYDDFASTRLLNCFNCKSGSYI